MKKYITTPFDSNRIPPRQNLFFLPLIWLLCWLLTRSGRLKIERVKMKGLKPPFLVLGTHHAFADFYITPLALFPFRANYVSELEGFENYGEWLYRQAGCLGTRKFVNDIALVRNIKRVIDRGDILVLYPEARYANVGTSSQLPASVGKLAKLLDVPVITINMHGNYLQSPIWNLKMRRGAKLDSTITQLFSKEQIRSASIEEINQGIKQALTYDEYTWQREKGMKIDEPWRAEGLELILYHCPCCNQEFKIKTEGARIFCGECGYSVCMSEYGSLEGDSGTKIVFTHIPEWYEWQRKQVEADIDAGRYSLSTGVRVEALPNAKNFIDLGEGRLIHGREGFTLSFTGYGEESEKSLHFSAASTFSVHTEYDYRGKGQCITLSTLDNTYFLFPMEEGFNATKIQFAAEYLYSCRRRQSVGKVEDGEGNARGEFV